jgi:hypothetical protein
MGIEMQPHRLLTIGEYLQERGLTPSAVRRTVPIFGHLVKRKYIMVMGRKPHTVSRYLNGQMVQVCLYRECDRHLFDLAWADLWYDLRITFSRR